MNLFKLTNLDYSIIKHFADFFFNNLGGQHCITPSMTFLFFTCVAYVMVLFYEARHSKVKR